MISCRKRGTQLTGRRRRGLGQQGRLEGDVLVGDAVPLVPRDRLARVERAVLHAVALLHLANAGLEICGNVVIALNTAFIHILQDMDECATVPPVLFSIKYHARDVIYSAEHISL